MNSCLRKAWMAVPAAIDMTAQTANTLEPSGLGEWTLGSIQSAGLPALSVSQISPRRLLISWPVSAGTAQLESTASLGSTPWSAVADALVVSNGLNRVIREASDPAQYYRLRKLP